MQQKLTIPETLDGVRADTAVAELTGVSRAWASEIVKAGNLTRADHVLKKSDRLYAGEVIELDWSEKPDPEIVPLDVPELAVIHEDDDIVVVSKPAGVAAHPSLGWAGPTVLGVLAFRGFQIATSGAHERQGIVHRLDQGTSGVMTVAKSEYAYSELKRQFKAREVHKIYHTVVHGHIDPFRGTIDAPIGRDNRSEWKFAVTADGRHAVTHYEMLEMFPHATLLEVGLETGRTHQIRVHMSSLRHPCVGDITYGADPTLAKKLGLERQWLHAVELEFTHPGSGERVTFKSDYSPDLAAALEILAT
ncbi:RluA family pseudouridine synthase [Canibacter zhoujuaniae]|uniref:RluA family pseudouridine synthase n=1 Tax=Canibacter zhoujuaniae TaxID=2708343 RepID=UPI0014239B5B|nr:RluA family pseudouridine synthase [Canibacter zhoujuaniae]